MASFLDGIDDLLYVREFERHYEWLLSLAEDAGKSAKDQSVVSVPQPTNVGVIDPPLQVEVMTTSTVPYDFK